MNLSRNKVQLQVEQLDERLVPSVTAALNSAGVLVVTGDGQNNAIRIERPGFGGFGSFQVTADGQRVNIAFEGNYYSSMDADNVEVYGLGGNDTIWTDSLAGFGGSVLMSGGIGNDLLSMTHAIDYRDSTLIGGAGSDILVGGRLTDYLNGNGGRDVLIGRQGTDHLYGGGEQDLLIPNFTDYDFDRPALRQIRSFWARTDLTYSQRVNGLRFSTNGYTGGRVDASTVHSDVVHDEMFGDAETDCFFIRVNQDDARDRVAAEWLIAI